MWRLRPTYSVMLNFKTFETLNVYVFDNVSDVYQKCIRSVSEVYQKCIRSVSNYDLNDARR